MTELEIKPEDVKPVDRNARTRLITTSKTPDYKMELRNILIELRTITQKINDIAPHIMPGAHDEEEHDIKIGDIIKFIASHYGVSALDMRSSRRPASITTPRFVAIYLSKKLTTQSYTGIGIYFGHRDHSTIIKAIARVELWKTRDETFTQELALFEYKLSKGI